LGKPLTFVFLVDALGWEIVQHFDFAPMLGAGRGPLGTVLGYSSAAIPSLLSGATPQEHESWSMFRLAGERSPFRFLNGLPKLPHALEWRARRWIRRYADRVANIQNYYDLYEIPLELLGRFDLGLHGDAYQPGGLPRETVFDRFVRDGVKYRMWYHKTGEAENFDEAIAAVSGDDDVLFVYTAELDALMHRVGIFDDAVAARLSRYESFLERVSEVCATQGRPVTFHLLSDHGMTNVTRSVDLWGYLSKRGYRVGRDYLGFYDSTMARLWCDDDIRDVAVEHLAASSAGRLLTEDELREFGCYFPDTRYGRWVLLADPGVMIVPSFMGGQQIAAMHGYDPNDKYSIGCFLTDAAGVAIPESILGFKDYIVARVAEVR